MTALAFVVLAFSQTSEPAAAAAEREAAPVARRDNDLTPQEQVRQAFDEELQSPVYKRLRTRLRTAEFDADLPEVKEPDWLSRFRSWVRGLFRTQTPTRTQAWGASGSGVGAGMAVVWVLFGLLLLIIAIAVIRSVAVRSARGSRKKSDTSRLRVTGLDPATPPGEVPSDVYLQLAVELADQGDHRQALRQLVLGAMSWIERGGLIRYRRGLTNRDYLRALRQAEQQRGRFADIVRDFERVYFGRRDATAAQFGECLSRYQEAFREAPASVPATLTDVGGAERGPDGLSEGAVG